MINKITLEEIEALIAKEVSLQVGLKTTVVLLTLRNGFEVVGTSACVDPKEYSYEIGTKYARQRAIDKVWEVEGYRLQADRAELGLNS